MRNALARLSLLGALLALTGCPPGNDRDAGFEDAPFNDLGPRDTSRPDGTGMDAGEANVDALEVHDVGEAAVVPDNGSLDAPATDAPIILDAGTVDAAGSDVPAKDPDAGVPTFDAAADVFLPGVCDLDATMAGSVCTGDSDCSAPIERCLDTGCGGIRRCRATGRPCVDGSDCHATAQTCMRGRCVAIGSDCGDTRACALGFNCEGAAGARSCIDRRHPCSPDAVCPFNSTCYSTAGIAGFCLNTATACAHDSVCLLGTRCRDIDGDGQTECVPEGPCSATSCAAGMNTCEVPPIEFLSVCGVHGFCSASRPCSSGYACIDAWGTGLGECHATTDPCQSHADCVGAQTLCYSALPYADSGSPGCR